MEKSANFGYDNSCNQSLDTDQNNVKLIEFVNIEVDIDTEENSLDNDIDPIAIKDGKLNR